MIVTRYREDVPKVVLINPDDLKMLEASHELIEGLGKLQPSPISDLALEALQAEERSAPHRRVESAREIVEILDL